MSGVTSAPGQFGQGPLSRGAAMVYTVLVVEALFLVTTLPGLVPLLLLDRDPSNLPVVAVCAVPLGPALSAALYALHHRRLDLTDLRPAPAFWRGYRLNLRPALRVWLPWLAWLTLIAVNLAHFGAAGVPGWWAALLLAVAAGAVLWGVNALVIVSLFDFRTVDVARLAVFFLVRRPGVTVGNACLAALVLGLTVLTSEAVPALLAAVFGLAVLAIGRPMIAEIRKDFTA